MEVLASVFLFLLSLAVSLIHADLSSKYDHSAVLDPKEKMQIHWSIDWTSNSISFGLEANTTGWVGLGISSGNGKMVGSDMVIGWVKDGQGFLTVSEELFVLKVRRVCCNLLLSALNCKLRRICTMRVVIVVVVFRRSQVLFL